MNSNERILAQLCKKLEGYRDSKESLNHKIVHLTLQFNSISKLIVETEEAIAALEGRTTETREMLEQAIKQNLNPAPRLLSEANPPIAPNANPPAEPGFRWHDGNLVPITAPATGEDIGVGIPLPPVDENFEPIDPMQFNPLV